MRLILCTVLMILALFSPTAFGVDPTPLGEVVTDQLVHGIEHADTHSEEQGVQGLGGSSAFTLVLMTLGAIAMPSLAKRIAIPVAVAEILYGFIIGDSGFGLINDPNDQFIRFLSDLGFAFFLFLAGLEIDFREIENRLKELILPFIISVLAFVCSMSISHALGWGTWMGLALGATSVPLLLAVVREMELGDSELGKTMIAFAAMGELVTIFLLSGIEIRTVADGDIQDTILGFVLLLSLVLVATTGASLLRTLQWWRPGLFRQMVAHDDPTEFGIRVGFGMMFFFIGLSILAHVEPFLGAFVAGAILSFVIRNKGALEHKLSSMAYGFFVPIFFIHVGMRLDISLGMLTRNMGDILLLIIIMFVVKLLPGMLMMLKGLKFKEVLSTCSLLAAPLTLVIAIMELGLHNPDKTGITPEVSAKMIAAGIFASLLYPSLARRLLKGETSDVETNMDTNLSAHSH